MRHGRPDKALHVYPLAHYADWARELPTLADRFAPGAFGDNIVVADAVPRSGVAGADGGRVAEVVEIW
ncbi:MAG: MOSC domain-containing protein [Rhodobacter sp.]|nr:MOSC domain-containing protein [Rhodobacter sp.]